MPTPGSLRSPSHPSRLRFAGRAGRLGAMGAVVLGLAAIPVVRSWAARGQRFVASSATWGYEQRGMLTDQGAYGLLFHTTLEKDPWVEVDLGAERDVRSIQVDNRSDCCEERAIPLRAEIAGEDGAFAEVARRDAPFERWTIALPAGARARFVRLVAERTTMLHLQSIRVR